MNILIALYPITDPKHPHYFKPEHLSAVREVAGSGAFVFATADKNEIADRSRDAEVIAGFPFALPELAQAKNLRWLHLFSAGADRALTPDIVERPVTLSNSSGIHATPIAEHVIAFMLIFTRGFYHTFRNQTRRVWERKDDISELRDKTVLIAGLGDIGREAARLAHAFGCRVVAVARSAKARPSYVDDLRQGEGLDDLVPEADFVVICLPHTADTHHLFDMKKLRLMKRSAVLINIGRGGIIKEDDLIAALGEGVIDGAALDVFEREPLPATSPLWGMENVVITPHHSGLSEKYMDRAVELFCKNLALWRAGKPLLTEVDKRRGY